jgi:hypothetical protein
MAESSNPSDTSSVPKQARCASDETKIPAAAQRTDQNPPLKAPTVHPLHELLCCEARNSLQVILSGAEILLEDHVGNLLTSQKELLTKMTDNAHHMNHLLSTLIGPEEFKLEELHEARIRTPRRVPAKV